MSEPIYKIVFRSNEHVVELFAKKVYQGDLFGFLVVEDMLFGERSKTLIDPAEEKLKNEFAEVKRTYLPLQNVIRVDEVERVGKATLKKASERGVQTNIIHTPFSK